MKWGVRRYQQYGEGGYLPKRKEGLAYKNRRDAERAGKKLRKNDKNGMSMFMEQSHDNLWQHVETRITNGERVTATPAEWAKGWEKAQSEGRTFENPYKLTQDVNDVNGELTDWALSRVNENFGERGTTNNCMKDTAGLICQQFGFDFMGGQCDHGIGSGALAYWFDNTDHHNKESNEVDSFLSGLGAGSFGGINISYSDTDDNGASVRTGGHEVFWKVNNDGRVKYYDGQPDGGMKFDSYNELIKANHADPDYLANIFDCTDAKPNWDHLGEDGVLRAQKTDAYGNVRNQKVRNKFDGRIVDRW